MSAGQHSMRSGLIRRGGVDAENRMWKAFPCAPNLYTWVSTGDCHCVLCFILRVVPMS